MTEGITCEKVIPTMKSEIQKSLEGIEGAQFVSLTYTSKNTGETARFTLIIGAKYTKVIEDSILELELTKNKLREFSQEWNLSFVIVQLAYEELLISLGNSLEAQKRGEANPDYTKRENYEHITTGLKKNLSDGTLEICGLEHSRKILVKGFKQIRESSEKTIAKNNLRKMLPIARYRTLCVDSECLDTMKVNGETLEFK